MPTTIHIDPQLRRERTWRLAAVELPLVRLAGSVLLALAVYVHNRFLLPTADPNAWLSVTAVVALYALLSWVAIGYLLRRDPPIDLTVPVLVGDLPVWTFAVYHSGAEESLLFFILLLRVADQVQTTFRRALIFALLAAGCYASMLLWVVVMDGRAIVLPVAMAKLVFILFAGVYISLTARTAERRRARLDSLGARFARADPQAGRSACARRRGQRRQERVRGQHVARDAHAAPGRDRHAATGHRR